MAAAALSSACSSSPSSPILLEGVVTWIVVQSSSGNILGTDRREYSTFLFGQLSFANILQLILANTNEKFS